ncbi:MAG: alpha-N-acetylglucosaminidase C-terminal domain-containing protein, partial [Bacteroidales bacterium]|nr:alpha-N-acetylglucosaminidase C-terminal domain-containing protein [Bacteroidales bacterium]
GNAIIDYASRDLSGLISSYYKVRWEMFFGKLKTSLKNNIQLNMDSIDKEMASFEWSWTDQQQSFNNEPHGNPIELVTEIHKKYSPLFNNSND